MKKIFYDTIKNEKGGPQEVILSPREARMAAYWDRVANALGFDVAITTLTTIAKKITEQKFYQVAPADFVPIRVGEGAWSDQIMTYRDYSLFNDFSKGIVQTGDQNSRLHSVSTGVDSVYVPVFNWATEIVYSIPQLEQAAKSGNWSLVEALHRAQKKDWDLGIQQVAFTGLAGANSAGLQSQALGLLNQNLSSVYGGQITVNTSFLTNSITSLAATPSNLSAFIGGLLNIYRQNCQSTAWPTHFVIPQSDFLGLATPSSPSFPLKSILELMQETFQTMTGNPNFQILPAAYADAISASNPQGASSSNQIYTLYNYAEESIRMDIPVDFTNTLANTLNNYQFQSAAYGQLTGVGVYRPAELLYLQFPASNL